MSAPGQKSSRCGEVAVSGGSTVYIHLTLNGHLAKTDSYSCYLSFFLLLVDLSKRHGHIERNVRLIESQIKGRAMKGTDQI